MTDPRKTDPPQPEEPEVDSAVIADLDAHEDEVEEVRGGCAKTTGFQPNHY